MPNRWKQGAEQRLEQWIPAVVRAAGSRPAYRLHIQGARGLAAAALGLAGPLYSAAPALQLELSVSGGGQVSSSPRGVDCFDRCTLRFASANGASLLAVPARGQVFVGWEGDACAAADSARCELLPDGSPNVVARFGPAPAENQPAIWREGDLHTHSDHSSDGSLPRQTLDDQAPGNMPLSDILRLAEGLALDYLPITDHRSYDQHYDPEWTSDQVLLIPGEEANGSPHATVHGGVDMIDQNAGVEGAPESRVVQESIWLAHSQGAVWVTAHPDDGEMNDDGTLRPRADAAGIDLVEIWNRASNPEAEIDYVENRWNAGYRFGVAGASDNHFKELWALGGTPARPSTEVLTAELSERAVLEALSAGRTDVFSRDVASPRVRIDADFDGDGIFEVQAGDEVFVPAGTPGRLRVRVDHGAGSRVLVYQSPGRSVAPIAVIAAPAAPGRDERVLDIVAAAQPTWYRAEARSIGLAEPASLLFGLALGPYELKNLFQELLAQLRAVTSPIFVSEAPVAPQGPFLPPPDAGVDDGAEYALGAPGAYAGFADAGFDAGSGALQVVAETHDAGITRIVHTVRSDAGRWSAPRILARSTRARFPRVAVAGRHVAVVWQDERAGQIPRRPAIYLRSSRDGGRHFGPEILIRAVDGQAMLPDVAVAADGRIHVVWQEIRAGEPFDVWYAAVDAYGHAAAAVNISRGDKVIRPASEVDARSARYPASVRPAIALDGDGVPVVAWQDNRFDPDPLWTGAAAYGEGTDPDDWQIAVLRSDGAASVPQYLGAADAADRHPDVVVDQAGRVHVAWDSKPLRSSGVNLRVLAAVGEPGADVFGDIRVVGEQAASSARQPRLGLDETGRARLAWFDSRSADWRWRVMSAAFDGGAWSDVSLIDARGVNTWPVPAGPYLVFSSTRNARRLQRDATQQVYVVERSAAEARSAIRVGVALSPPGLRLSPMPQEDAD